MRPDVLSSCKKSASHLVRSIDEEFHTVVAVIIAVTGEVGTIKQVYDCGILLLLYSRLSKNNNFLVDKSLIYDSAKYRWCEQKDQCTHYLLNLVTTTNISGFPYNILPIITQVHHFVTYTLLSLRIRNFT